MRTMREAILLTAAIGMTTTGSMSSYAVTGAAATAVSHTETDLADGGGADSATAGYIRIINISVKVPIAPSFDIDPNVKIKADDSVTTQMGGQADNYTITNLSIIPLEISITAVAPGVGVNLVDTVNDLGNADKNVLFAIHEAKEAPPTLPGTKNNKIWMNKTDIKKGAPYHVRGDKAYTIEAVGTSATPNEETRTDVLKMKVYAAATCGWKSGNSFTITPAFTVSLQTGA